jgi:hypothetical protein
MKIPLPGLPLLVLALNLILCTAYIAIIVLYSMFTTETAELICQELDCRDIGDAMLVMFMIIQQVFWLAIGWQAHLLGRSGRAWLGASAIPISLLLTSLVISFQYNIDQLGIAVMILLLLVTPLQFLWLLKRGWREIHRLYVEE